MNEFTFTYPTKVYFGEGAAKKSLPAELAAVGDTVMLAYGGGSVKANGIYDELTGILKEAGKEDTILLGYDVYPEIVPYIKDSTIDAVIYQDLPAQIYKAVELLFDYVCYGIRPEKENYYLPLNVVFATNCEYFENL